MEKTNSKKKTTAKVNGSQTTKTGQGAHDSMLHEFFIDSLKDIYYAEKHLVKALPKMAKSARTVQLQTLFETHLMETEEQVERLNESLAILGTPARAKPCKGMAGLVEEGEETMRDGKNKGDACLAYEDPNAAHSAGGFYNGTSLKYFFPCCIY
jgi:hypothetical protein